MKRAFLLIILTAGLLPAAWAGDRDQPGCASTCQAQPGMCQAQPNVCPIHGQPPAQSGCRAGPTGFVGTGAATCATAPPQCGGGQPANCRPACAGRCARPSDGPQCGHMATGCHVAARGCGVRAGAACGPNACGPRGGAACGGASRCGHACMGGPQGSPCGAMLGACGCGMHQCGRVARCGPACGAAGGCGQADACAPRVRGGPRTACGRQPGGPGVCGPAMACGRSCRPDGNGAPMRCGGCCAGAATCGSRTPCAARCGPACRGHAQSPGCQGVTPQCGGPCGASAGGCAGTPAAQAAPPTACSPMCTGRAPVAESRDPVDQAIWSVPLKDDAAQN